MAEETKNDTSKIIQTLLENDSFSQWMNIKILDAKPGFCKIECKITKEMTNGFGVTHGGILFSLADSALAFSAATLGRVALALDNSISFTHKSFSGDVLTATSNAINTTHKTGVFDVKIQNQDGKMVAVMKGTVYRTGEQIIVN